MRRKAFDLRRYLKAQARAPKQTTDRFNLYMSMIGDIPLRVLLTARPSDLFEMLLKNGLKQQRRKLKWKNPTALMRAARQVLKLAGNRTGQQLFATRRSEDPKLDRAIKRVRALGVFIPTLQQNDDLREQYFRKLIVGRTVHYLGRLTPRDFFEKGAHEISALQRSVVIEAKIVGLLGKDSCGDGEPKPVPTPVNNTACEMVGSTSVGFCTKAEQGAHCVEINGSCTIASDPGAEEPPVYEPLPGGGSSDL